MRTTRTCVALVLAVAAISSAAISDAGAAVRRSATGYPGAVALKKVNGLVGQTWNDWGLSTLQMPGPTVYRSRATTGNQRICVNRVVHKFIASTPGHGPNPWRFQDSRQTCATVAPGYRRTFSTWNMAGQPFVSYKVYFFIRWWTPSGRLIGKSVYDYNDPADYQCLTPKCQALVVNGSGAVYFDI